MAGKLNPSTIKFQQKFPLGNLLICIGPVQFIAIAFPNKEPVGFSTFASGAKSVPTNPIESISTDLAPHKFQSNFPWKLENTFENDNSGKTTLYWFEEESILITIAATLQKKGKEMENEIFFVGFDVFKILLCVYVHQIDNLNVSELVCWDIEFLNSQSIWSCQGHLICWEWCCSCRVELRYVPTLVFFLKFMRNEFFSEM